MDKPKGRTTIAIARGAQRFQARRFHHSLHLTPRTLQGRLRKILTKTKKTSLFDHESSKIQKTPFLEPRVVGSRIVQHTMDTLALGKAKGKNERRAGSPRTGRHKNDSSQGTRRASLKTKD
eukprot:scaffold133041_cov31-Tisochrysis_lutea.AAC.6